MHFAFVFKPSPELGPEVHPKSSTACRYDRFPFFDFILYVAGMHSFYCSVLCVCGCVGVRVCVVEADDDAVDHTITPVYLVIYMYL